MLYHKDYRHKQRYSVGTNVWIWSNGRSFIDLHNLMDHESQTMTHCESRKKTYDSVSTFIIEMIIGKHTQFLINPNKILGQNTCSNCDALTKFIVNKELRLKIVLNLLEVPSVCRVCLMTICERLPQKCSFYILE